MNPRAWRRFRDIVHRNRVETDLDDELRFHLDMEVERLAATGMSPADASAAARRQFGAVSQMKDEVRDAHGIDRVESVIRDFRVAARALRRTPALVAVIWLTLALGIGATTAVFSVVHAVLLAGFPFPDAEQVVIPQAANQSGGHWNVTWRDYISWHDASLFENAALYQRRELDIVVDDTPIRAQTAVVTAGFFPTLGIKALLGRLPTADEFLPTSERPLVISYGLWQRLGGMRGIVGRTVRLSGSPVTIVGVLPNGSSWPQDADAWFPLTRTPDAAVMRPDNYIFWAVARLKPGQSLEQASVRIAGLAKNLESDFPAERKGITAIVQPLRQYLVGDSLQKALWVLLGGVVLVLLIACANIANLLLARAVARRHELAVRIALGASPRRLIQQLLIESLVLVAPGGALGVAVAALGVQLLPAFAPAGLPGLDRVGLHPLVLATAAAITMVAALLVSVVPALHALRTAPMEALVEAGTRATAGARTRQLAATLVVGEVALSLTLLASAGLLLHSLVRLTRVDTGMDSGDVLTFGIALPQQEFKTGSSIIQFWSHLTQDLEAVPGVTGASFTTGLPLNGGGFYLGRTLIADGAAPPPAGTEVPIMWHAVGPAFFRTVGQRLIAGREFNAQDDSAGAKVIIVTESFARSMFPNTPAVGQRVVSWRDEKLPREIVGVVGDVRYWDATDAGRALVYVPMAQWIQRSGVVVIRTAGEPSQVTSAARRVLASLNPGIAMARVQTMSDIFFKVTAQARFNARLLALFAGLALLLAAIGLYGLLAYQVAQQRIEFGVRMALGASRSVIARLVIGRSVKLVVIGGGIGLLGAFAASRLLRSMLYEIAPTDPVALVAVTVIMLAVALTTGWLTARRATAIDPATTLRGG